MVRLAYARIRFRMPNVYKINNDGIACNPTDGFLSDLLEIVRRYFTTQRNDTVAKIDR